MNKSYYIGLDLAWGEKNPSGFCVLACSDTPHAKIELVELKLLYSLDEILVELSKYQNDTVALGIDAPLVIPNESGNREIEKAFNKDFSKYKISMLPVNRNLLRKFSPNLRSEELYKKLLACGYKRDVQHAKTIFEVYTHSTIAVCFNDYRILPYKRKKGRNTAFIKEQLGIYGEYIKAHIEHHGKVDGFETLKGQALKHYEDQLDAITCAYAMYTIGRREVKYYSVDGIDTFVTPI